MVTDASASTYFPLNHNSLSASFASSHHCNLPSAVTTTGEPYSLASDYTARKIALTDEIVRILDAHDDVSSKVVDFMREVMSSKLNNALHVTHTPVKRRTRVEHTHPFPHPPPASLAVEWHWAGANAVHRLAAHHVHRQRGSRSLGPMVPGRACARRV